MMQTLYLQRECLGWKVEIQLDFVGRSPSSKLSFPFYLRVRNVVDAILRVGNKKITYTGLVADYCDLPIYLAQKISNYFQKIKITKKHPLYWEVEHMKVDAKITVWKDEKEYLTVRGTVLQN